MILVADSGSTKTTWADVETGNKIVTEGLNPHFCTDQQVLDACQQVRQKLSIFNSQISIHFYGAGCGNNSQRGRIASLLCKAFGTSNVHVDTDMLGACRAVGGKQTCLVGILGTGSNICSYDGKEITCQPLSTGYILGDFGSANHLGRVLLNGYLSHNMPSSLRDTFHDRYQMSDSEFIDAVYHHPHPNRFLASLAPFAIQHLEDDYCRRAITLTLEDWVVEMVMPLWRDASENEVLHVIGGYAKAIEPTLRSILENDGLVVGKIIADPIEGLREYHFKNS